VLFVRGWLNDTATATAPKARDVQLLNDTSTGCPDKQFASVTASCGIGVQAKLDFGTGSPTTYTVQAEFGNQKRTMLFNSTTGLWRTGTSTGNSGPITVDPAAGPVPITITWKKGGNSGDFGVVQRFFSANDASGPIMRAQITDADTSLFPANSFQRCDTTYTGCNRHLTVSLGLKGSFADLYSDATSVTTPVPLKFGASTGSQTQALDCDPWDPAPNLEAQIAYGCRPAYTKNTGTACPDKNTLWGSSTSTLDQGPAWQCVALAGGGKTGQVAPGMNLRILGDTNATSCTQPNMWPARNIGDPRIIHLIITQFGAFGGSGTAQTVPVTNFATFYVTGWRGNGGAFGKNPCQNPALQSLPHHDDLVNDADISGNDGVILGHFFEYTGPLDGTPSSEACNFTGPTPCISVLTQ
jgi:hypothetical protein